MCFCSGTEGADKNFRFDGSLFEILRLDAFSVCFCGIGFDQMNGDAAETAAGKTGAETLAVFAGDIDEDIEFGSAVFKILPAGFMGVKEQLTESGNVAVFEQ